MLTPQESEVRAVITWQYNKFVFRASNRKFPHLYFFLEAKTRSVGSILDPKSGTMAKDFVFKLVANVNDPDDM
jgi:hypothetical protein